MDNTAHRRAWELMPWVASGSATEAECLFVEEHLQGCADCREESAFHQNLHRALQQSERDVHDGEPALQRLMARIEAGAPRAEHSATYRPVRWLVAAVVVQAVGLAAAGVALWERGTAPDYRTLSSVSNVSNVSSVSSGGMLADIRLVPAATLGLAELQSLLARHGLQVVEVSSDARLWSLAAPGSAQDKSALLQRLRTEPGVLLAEPIIQ